MANHPEHQTDRAHWQAERLVPTAVPWHKKKMIEEHTRRYEFACSFVGGKDVVDLACGTGYGCMTMMKAGAKHVIGMDISAEAVEYANDYYSNPDISYFKRDITKTALPDHVAEVVTSFETIEHLTDDRAFITEVRRILKPNGIFIMSTPNIEFSTGANPYHVREYTLAKCEKLLAEFSSVKAYGQRKVFRPIFNIMKGFPTITSFRPWEQANIVELKSSTDTDYCYFIFVCRV